MKIRNYYWFLFSFINDSSQMNEIHQNNSLPINNIQKSTHPKSSKTTKNNHSEKSSVINSFLPNTLCVTL